jgi:hypothetical protein
VRERRRGREDSERRHATRTRRGTHTAIKWGQRRELDVEIPEAKGWRPCGTQWCRDIGEVGRQLSLAYLRTV